MRVFDNFAHVSEALSDSAGSVVTIGVFDGIHLGHQALVRRTIGEARSRGLASLLVTFSEHPLAVLAPPYCPKKLIYADRKEQLLSELGVDMMARVDFTEGFSQQTPKDFVENVLVPLCRARMVVCGYDFSFGKGGGGDVALLRGLGQKHGFEVAEMDAVNAEEIVVKSTMIRDLLYGGDIERVTQLLSRPYELRGLVVAGFSRGNQIGFPTANLHAAVDHVAPARGVYFCAVRIAGERTLHAAMTNIGYNPTFGPGRKTIETHILDFSRQIRGQVVQVFFLHRLRDEQKFESLEALVAQLHRDRDESRRLVTTSTIQDQFAQLAALIKSET
jgi:riboflavin kinase / FMN adenylyltransferase